MKLIRSALTQFDTVASRVLLRVDRIKREKRRWRGTAEDGAEFGFELEEPMRHGQPFFEAEGKVYFIEQLPEPVLETELKDNPSEAAKAGWTIGNLHMPLEVDGSVMRAADDPALHQLFKSIGVPYRKTEAIFQPMRGTASGHSHGHSHSHSHGHRHH